MDTIDKILKDIEKYRSEKQYDLVIEKYTEAIALLFKIRGHTFGSLKQFDNEFADFTSALNLTTDVRLKNDLLFARGLNCVIMKNYEQAIVDLTAVIKERPFFTHFYMRGIAFEETGDYKRARKDYNTTLKLFPSHQEARQGLESLTKKESEE